MKIVCHFSFSFLASRCIHIQLSDLWENLLRNQFSGRDYLLLDVISIIKNNMREIGILHVCFRNEKIIFYHIFAFIDKTKQFRIYHKYTLFKNGYKPSIDINTTIIKLILFKDFCTRYKSNNIIQERNNT